MMLFEICLRIAKVIFFEFEICEILNLSFTIRIVFFFFFFLKEKKKRKESLVKYLDFCKFS